MNKKEGDSSTYNSRFFFPQKKIRHLKSLSIRNIKPIQSYESIFSHKVQTYNINIDNTAFDKSENNIKQQYESKDQINNPISNINISKEKSESLSPYKESLLRLVRLENALKNYLVDTFFALYINNIEHPLYISEIVTKTMNPDFLSFDFSMLTAAFNCFSSFSICIWISNGGPFQLLRKQIIHLPSLNYIGENLHSFKSTFPRNCIILRFNNGYYSCDNLVCQPLCSPINLSKTKECYSYHNIIKLNTLEKCILDANKSKKALEKSLETYLDKYYKIFNIQKQKNNSSKHLSELKNIIILENKKLREVKEYKYSFQKSLDSRRQSIKLSQQNQQKVVDYLEEAKKTLQCRKEILFQIQKKISAYQSRIVTELQNIFPIKPIVDKPLNFTICGLLLPNTNYYKHDNDHIAASLGYTAHLIYLLSFYLGIPLKYPIRPMCSRAVIEDPISGLQNSKSFPLWSKGQDHYQFNFAVFLLNKNIEQVSSYKLFFKFTTYSSEL
ncbi:hypothetical protein PCANB_000455 [Pneumocystis canis]|nr:hypothetical protein PCANB_000455 [Pneumocystis canis]